jgi:hypothetical protein
MAANDLTDSEAKEVLAEWPARTNSLWTCADIQGHWLRACPKSGVATMPNLSSPGARSFKTSPDGRYVYFHVNCRHARWSESIATQGGGQMERWKASGTIARKLNRDTARPIRFLRVLYALKNNLYSTWRASHVPSGWEFYCRYSSLSGYGSQNMQGFLRGMSMESHFFTQA